MVNTVNERIFKYHENVLVTLLPQETSYLKYPREKTKLKKYDVKTHINF